MSYGGDRKPLNQAREEEPNKGERERPEGWESSFSV